MKKNVEREIEDIKNILQIHAQEIYNLRKKVTEMMQYRNPAIKADLANGMKGKDAAIKCKLSKGRISQIKNSDRK